MDYHSRLASPSEFLQATVDLDEAFESSRENIPPLSSAFDPHPAVDSPPTQAAINEEYSSPSGEERRS